MNYAEISKETFSFLYKSYESLKKSPLESTIRVLIEIRVSLINGCDYCYKVHTAEAKTLDIPQEKIDALSAWESSKVFSDEEIAALQWAEALTNLDENLDKTRAELDAFYSERELVDLTACVSIMNALNRIAIALRK